MNPTEVMYPPDIPTARFLSPVVFLAGPIQGARDWQQEAVDFFKINTEGLLIANPRRPIFPVDEFEKQVLWETRMLKEASFNGVLLFWLEKEEIHSCDRAFAQTTRFELGEWLAKANVWPTVRVVLGIHPEFPGGRYIVERASRMPFVNGIQTTLTDTCRKVLLKLRSIPEEPPL